MKHATIRVAIPIGKIIELHDHVRVKNDDGIGSHIVKTVNLGITFPNTKKGYDAAMAALWEHNRSVIFA